MTMINHHNYEEYALDYLEGTLPEKLRTEFEAFLLKEPSIKAELELMADFAIAVPDEQLVFEPKSVLLRKEGTAKIVVLNTKFWYKMTAIAAAIGLLMVGYFAGYKTGYQNNINSVAQTTTLNKQDVSTTEKAAVEIRDVAEKIDNQLVISDTKKEVSQIIEDNSRVEEQTNYPFQYLDGNPVANEEQASSHASIKPEMIAQRIESDAKEKGRKNTSIPSLLSPPTMKVLTASPSLSMEDKAQYLSDMIMIAQHPEGLWVKTPSPQKRTRFRDLFGKLPFDGVSKEAFIPSYFTE